MEFVSTAVVVAIVVVLMLLGIGMVVNQLLRLRKWLNASPPGKAPTSTTANPGPTHLLWKASRTLRADLSGWP